MKARHPEIVQHEVVDLVHASGHGFEEASASDDGVERHGDAFRLQLPQHKLLAEVELVRDAGEAGQFFDRVAERALHAQRGVLVDGYLGGRRAGIDG